MKQIPFTNHKGEEFLFVEVPKDCSFKKHKVIDEYIQCHHFVGKDVVQTNISLPQGNWQLIAPLSEMTEELWNGVVRKVTLGYWLDYTKTNTRHDYMCHSPSKSGESLLQSLGIEITEPYILLKEI